MTRKLKYLSLGTVFSLQFLYINLAQADEWILTKCSKISNLGTQNLPSKLQGLADFHWGISVSDEKRTITNLGTISISLNRNSDMTYPIKGNMNPQTKFTIKKIDNTSNFQIDIVTTFNLLDQIDSNNSARLSECNTESCKCNNGTSPDTKPTTYTKPPVIRPHDPEEVPTASFCSCAVS